MKKEELRVLWSWVKFQILGDVCKDVPNSVFILAKKYGCLYNGSVYKGGKRIRKTILKKGDYITLKPVYSSWSKSKFVAKEFFGSEMYGTRKKVVVDNLLLKGQAKDGIDITKTIMVIKKGGINVGHVPPVIELEKEVVAKITRAKIIDIYYKNK